MRASELSASIINEGVEVRRTFALHAPRRIPDWFEPIMSAPEPQPPPNPALPVAVFGDDIGKQNYIFNMLRSWIDDPIYDLDRIVAPSDPDLAALVEAARPALRAFQEAVEAYRDAHRVWLADWNRQTVAQWPWAWADLVLAAGDRR
jgi:hypothetical protein